MGELQKHNTHRLTKKESLLYYQQPTTNNQQPTTNNQSITLSFFFLLLSLILAAPTLNAQIKIEERVEIAPQQILSDDPQFGLELEIGVYPSLLAPGDIREIGLSLCERRSFYGCYIIDFPQGQLFDAAITWDPFPGENEYNTPKLVSGTQISDTLLGVEEGFYFKAPEYLTVSYMVAVLEVKTYISGYGLIQDDYLVRMMLDTSLVISFNPANISPSDTSEIVIEKIRSDGVKIPYHPLQQFEVGIIEGCTAGKLLAAGDTASYFNRVTQPIYFVAADSIDEEEDTLKIRVGLNQELIDTYLPLKIKYEKQLAKQEKEEKGELKITEEEKPLEPNPSDNPMISSCSFSTFESFLYEDVTKVVGDLINILYNPQTYPIDFVPKMPNDLDIIVQPKLFSGPYSFDWDLEVKWVSTKQDPDKTFLHTFHNQQLGVLPNGTEIVLPETDETIVGGDDLTLTVRYTDDNFPNGITVIKKLTGMKILGTNAENNIQLVKDYIANHEFPDIDLPLSEVVTKADQKKQMQVIVDKESDFFQFFDVRYPRMPHGPNDVGYPNMNPNPHDWGLCQLSIAEPSLGIIWDWKTNINAGIHFLWGTDTKIHKYAQIKKKFNDIKEEYVKYGKEVRDPNRQEFLLMLTQHYKRGFYYTDYVPGKKRADGYWKKTDKEGWFEYGDDFCILFGFSQCK